MTFQPPTPTQTRTFLHLIFELILLTSNIDNENVCFDNDFGQKLYCDGIMMEIMVNFEIEKLV